MFHTFAPHWRYAWLVTASFIAGVMNAMAGGGSFLSFPAMLGMGIPPIEANATNTVALWPGQATSLAKLQADVRRDLLLPVLTASLLGGVCGAVILLHTGQALFLHLIPWRLLTGALLFWFRLRSRDGCGLAHDGRAGRTILTRRCRGWRSF